jgi:hypothetical protein
VVSIEIAEDGLPQSQGGTFGGEEEEVLPAVMRAGGQALGAVGDLGDMPRLPRVHPRHRERQG